MSALLRIRDEYFGTPAGDDPAPFELRLVSERVSPREIIRQRVFAEVAEVNERRESLTAGLSNASADASSTSISSERVRRVCCK